MASGALSEARSYARSAGVLTAALATAGALAYAFFAVASHTLDRDDYGRIVVLWSAVYLTISTLFRPVEQLLSRTIAELEERGRPTAHVLKVAAAIQLALAAVFVIVALLARKSLQDDLFDGESLYFWTLVGAVVAFSASYYARGYLAGSRRMGSYAVLMIVEGFARFVLALVVAIGIVEGAAPVVIGIGLAPLVSLLVVPFALRRRLVTQNAGRSGSGASIAVEATPDFTLAQGSGFAAAVLLIMLSEQIILNSGPLFARVNEGAAAAGFIFNVLMVARAPVVLFQAVAASLLPHLTRLRSRGNETAEEAFRLSIRMTIAVIVGFAAVTLLAVLAVGPQAMQIAFGDNFEYDRAELGLVALGMGFYLVAATLNQAALAQGQVRRAAVCWVVCALAFVGWNLVPVLDTFARIELGFAASAALLCALLFAVSRAPERRAEDVPAPGSPLELELRAAAADEVG